MTVSVRDVIARYREEPQNMGPFEHDPDWSSYMEEKSKTFAKPSQVILKMMDKNYFKDTMKDVDPGVSTNPYDYEDPNTAPKDQKGSAPFTNQVFPETDGGAINRPQVFEEDKSLDQWKKVREEDWTEDEDQQSPAMSEHRSPGAGRCAHDHNNRTAASLREVLNKDTHYNNDAKNVRAGAVRVKLIGDQAQRDKGLYTFNATSTSGKPRKVFFQFLRPEGEGPTSSSLLDYPVQLSCTCESFLYFGAQYYAIHDNYMYRVGIRAKRRDRNIAPTPRDQVSSTRFDRNNPGRGVNFRVCKHILACYHYLEGLKEDVNIKKPFKGFPVIGPPTPLMNSKVWLDLFGFDFDKPTIRRLLKKSKPVTPAFFRSRSISKKFIEWMRTVWLPRTDDEKIRVIDSLSEHPEEIFLILLKDAYYTGGKTSDYLIDTGFDIMDRVIQARTPKEDIKEPEEGTEVGMGDVEELPTVEDIEESKSQGEEYLNQTPTKKQYEKKEKHPKKIIPYRIRYKGPKEKKEEPSFEVQRVKGLGEES